jgi:hypothetical protein
VTERVRNDRIRIGGLGLDSATIRFRPLDPRRMPEIQQPVAGHERGGATRSRGGVSPEMRGTATAGPRGFWEGSGAIRVTRQSQLWASHRRGSTRGHRTRRKGSAVVQTYSGEQLRDD